MQPVPIVFLTVDTEEDAWGAYQERNPTVRNVRHLRKLQEICDRYGATPTYLANYPVVNDPGASSVLAELTDGTRGEIGTHLHTWNTPPFDVLDGPNHTMLSGLPEELVQRKLLSVHRRIVDRFGEPPTTFRSGRWGFGPRVARALIDLGYEVDSSVTPLLDWTAEGGPDYRSAPLGPYRLDSDRVTETDPSSSLIEIPATRGFLWGDAYRRMRWRERLAQGPAAPLRVVGLLDALGVIALRWLSPELSGLRDLRRLARNLVAQGVSSLNFTLHSPSLEPGLTPFVQSRRALDRFYYRIEGFLDFAASQGYRFALLSRGPHMVGFSTDKAPAGEDTR